MVRFAALFFVFLLGLSPALAQEAELADSATSESVDTSPPGDACEADLEEADQLLAAQDAWFEESHAHREPLLLDLPRAFASAEDPGADPTDATYLETGRTCVKRCDGCGKCLVWDGRLAGVKVVNGVD